VIDYLETIPRTARIGGLEPRYGYVTVDSNTLANGSSSVFGADSRQFEFEAISISNIESIEVNRTLSADMSADAPAGTINLRTKSALDRRRGQFSYTAGLSAINMSIRFHADPPRRRPPRESPATASFDYSDTFLRSQIRPFGQRRLDQCVQGAIPAQPDLQLYDTSGRHGRAAVDHFDQLQGRPTMTEKTAAV